MNMEPQVLTGKPELPAESRKDVESHDVEFHEKTGEGLPVEIVDAPRYELEGSWRGSEMPDR